MARPGQRRRRRRRRQRLQPCLEFLGLALSFILLLLVIGAQGFQSPSAGGLLRPGQRLVRVKRAVTPPSSSPVAEATTTAPAAQTVAPPKQPKQQKQQQQLEEREQGDWRRLGSFETLLARKAAKGPQRLSIPHACVALVEGPPIQEAALRSALLQLVRKHPLLRARIKGTGRVEGAPLPGVRLGAREVDPLRWAPCALTDEEVVDRALRLEHLDASSSGGGGGSSSSTGAEWYAGPFEAALDATDFDQAQGPLWRLHVLSRGDGKGTDTDTALLFAFNHAISDQASANTVVHKLLSALAAGPAPQQPTPQPQPFPPSIETAVLAGRGPGLNTLRYAAREGLLGALPCTILPDPARRSAAGADGCGDASWGLPAATRKTLCELRRLEPPTLAALVAACRRRGLTVTAALSAAMLYVTSDAAHAPVEGREAMQSYRLLLSLNMRAFSAQRRRRRQQQQQETAAVAATAMATATEDWAEGAVASAAGAMDYLARVPTASATRLLQSTASAASTASTVAERDRFWAQAASCRAAYEGFVAAGFVPESVALFDWGVRAIELNEVVEAEAENPRTLGRAYTCGVSNMGVFPSNGGQQQQQEQEQEQGAAAAGGIGGVGYGPLLRLRGLHYATSSSLTGTLYQLSCGTVGGALCLTLHGAWPLIDRAALARLADQLVAVLACVAAADD